jgi:trans-aconitate methyltransferase
MTTEHVPGRAFGRPMTSSDRLATAPDRAATIADWAAAGTDWATTSADWALAGTTADATPRAALELAARGATLDPPRTPVDESLIEAVAELAPGKALDLGCGSGQNAVWLAQRGWVVTAVDISPGAIAEARSAAAAAGVSIVFDVADITAWRPASRFDLVVSTFALPARGMGRGRMLEMAAAAVAPGGAILVTEFDIKLSRDGRMAEKYLVSREEVERYLDGFRVNRSRTRMTRHRHGYEELVLPVATVVATRRTDLRSPW